MNFVPILETPVPIGYVGLFKAMRDGTDRDLHALFQSFPLSADLELLASFAVESHLHSFLATRYVAVLANVNYTDNPYLLRGFSENFLGQNELNDLELRKENLVVFTDEISSLMHNALPRHPKILPQHPGALKCDMIYECMNIMVRKLGFRPELKEHNVPIRADLMEGFNYMICSDITQNIAEQYSSKNAGPEYI
jgi:hypothetical protein